MEHIAEDYEDALQRAETAYRYVHAHFDLSEQVRQLAEAIRNADISHVGTESE
jgi:hypothetical protein